MNDEIFNMNIIEKILNDNGIILNIQCDIINKNSNIRFSLLHNYNEILISTIEHLYLEKYNLNKITKNGYFNFSNYLLNICKQYLVYKILEYMFYINNNNIIITCIDIETDRNILKMIGFININTYDLVEIYDCGFLEHYKKKYNLIMEIKMNDFIKFKDTSYKNIF